MAIKDFLQKVDEALSAPIQKLPSSFGDYILSFPDGELSFGPKKVFTMQLPLIILVHFIWTPILPAALTVMTFGMFPLVVLKALFPRDRPLRSCGPARLVDVRALAHSDKDSFPSGCAGGCATMMGLLSVWTGTSIWLAVLPVAMFTRIYFHCHWVLDTIVGAAMGLTASYSVHWLFDLTTITFSSAPFLGAMFLLPVLLYVLKLTKGKVSKA